MKKLILIAASLMVALTSYGQGQFFFTNRDTTAGVNARFVLSTDTGTTSSIGTDYTVTLTGGAAGAATLVPLEPSTTTFRGAAGANTAGYVTPVTVTVPGVAAGAAADVLVSVTGPGGSFSQKFTIPSLGGGAVTPPTIPLGAANLIVQVPEPTTLALGVLGLGALLAIRRRK
jgi:MYXO-CTERM domain-containing protein